MSSEPAAPSGPRRIFPVSTWLPEAGGPQRHVVLRLPEDVQGSALAVAVAVRVFPAASGTTLYIAVAGVSEPRERDAEALVAMLPVLSEDRSSLPDIELVGDGEHVAGALDVFDVTGNPQSDAAHLLAMAAHLSHP